MIYFQNSDASCLFSRLSRQCLGLVVGPAFIDRSLCGCGFSGHAEIQNLSPLLVA